jgi:DNA-directed RNA polymerase subunit RPC12/RpoP
MTVALGRGGIMKKEDFRCPGQNTMFWKPGDIYDVSCPNCGKPVEFWKDDAKRTCTCGHRFLNPKRDIGCLEWCKYAETCMPEMFKGENLQAFYRDRLLAAAKKELTPDDKLVAKALDVLEVAEELISAERGEPKVIIASILLHELLGAQDDRAAVIRKILADVKTEDEVIDKVCNIIQGTPEETGAGNVNLEIVSDAQNMVRLRERKGLLEKTALERLIEAKLATQTAQQLARERFL